MPLQYSSYMNFRLLIPAANSQPILDLIYAPPDWFYFCSSLQDLILHEPNKFGSYLSTLLPVWLKIAKNKEKSINLRIKALNCIQTVTKAETQDLVPYKKEVINGLIPALDDHKRLVRQAATSARNSWCLSWNISVINTYI